VPKLTAHTAPISTMKPLGPKDRCGVSTALKRDGSCGGVFASVIAPKS